MTVGTTARGNPAPTPRTDPVLGRVADAVGLRVQGRREAARTMLLEIWDEIGTDGDPLHRCSAAHALAGVQDDPAAELEWHLRALLAADQVSSLHVNRAAYAAVELYPSLHLNLADVYLRLGRPEGSRTHLHLGRSALVPLPDGAAGRVLADGLDRVEARLSRGAR